MKDFSINTIILKNIIEYQYSSDDEWWDVLQLSHANDIQELVNISNELYKCNFINFSNHTDYIKYTKIINQAKRIFKQYGYPLQMWTSFCSENL